MVSNLPHKTRRPFEADGRFFPGFVQRAGTKSRSGRRRVLCFVTNRGTLGASASFSRSEAYHVAQQAEQGTLPEPSPGITAAVTLTHLLKTRGFPVSNVFDELDDQSGEVLQRELWARAGVSEVACA